MQGKTVVITGGTSGIGQVAGEALAKMGARIVLVARSKSRGEAALSRLQAIGPGRKHDVHYGDLSRLTEMRRVAKEIAAAETRIDVLINNAGAMFDKRQVTEDGLELTFATNHLSYFVMTHLLSERLITSAPSRVINTSSNAHYRGTMDFDNLEYEHDYKAFPAYSRSKLCNVLFTRVLARRLNGTGVTANSLHPGFVKTRFGDESGGRTAFAIRLMKMLFAISLEKGAETIIYLASSNEASKSNGLYFYQCKPVEPSKLAQDDAVADRLWQLTGKIAGIPD
ncbi:MAG TPA: SDR family oxidoreductase [Bryobacteraceae bacterium]|jgi:NAD(P)-dependent dehydrogenase (short-subunit alcohol dehydrogenase family)|nr:SDR family oxidoreductase [Bryobacteraceae bacterium]